MRRAVCGVLRERPAIRMLSDLSRISDEEPEACDAVLRPPVSGKTPQKGDYHRTEK